MAVIHISEAEAAGDFPGLIAKVRAGEEVRIGTEADTIAVLRGPDAVAPRKTLSDAIRRAKERNLDVLLDDQFARDLEIVISDHACEEIRNPWGD